MGTDEVENWGQAIARRFCHSKGCIAVARKLAVIMHAMAIRLRVRSTPRSAPTSRTAGCWEGIHERRGGK
ncbi:hypothetical protein [Mesorhizobium sp. CA6]|uniref:hypothetical protein n=1 Tax=Mesorhizobium sp. CA6 TaxID=588500 RepID=UPI002961F20D|nr:hypothetical protein [Mesorhizobium sp. CA6]